MTWKLQDREFASVIRLPDDQRYEYFVKRVADRGAVWSLRGSDGWVLAGDELGRELHPVWPHPRYAEACANGDWAGAVASQVDLRDWLTAWTSGMLEAGRLVAVFPTPTMKGAAISPDALAADLREELGLIE